MEEADAQAEEVHVKFVTENPTSLDYLGNATILEKMYVQPRSVFTGSCAQTILLQSPKATGTYHVSFQASGWFTSILVSLV